jgi:coenzyme F420 hydrogenase subunit beta
MSTDTFNLKPEETQGPLGKVLSVWKGYASDEAVRAQAASGGIVSALLIHLLETNQIQGALLCKTLMREGRLDYEIFIARNREEVLSAQTSKYFDIPMFKGLEQIKAFEGRVAVVGLPSQIHSFRNLLNKNEELNEKIPLLVAIFCGHNSQDKLVKEVWSKKGIAESEIEEFYYRKGLWRGRMHLRLRDGRHIDFPFQDFSHYQNLHILSLHRCLNCFDHMGFFADIATGDIWMKSERSSEIKKSVFLSRTNAGEAVLQKAIKENVFVAEVTDMKTLYLSQRRSINYHYNLSARARLAKFFGLKIRERVRTPVSLQDYMAAFVVLLNHTISKSPRLLKMFMKLPRPFVVAYVYFFKAFTHYTRKEYFEKK